MTEERLMNIETTLMDHERQIADLSAVITAQWKDIDRLKLLLAAAQARLEDLDSSAPAANTKPPHY